MHFPARSITNALYIGVNIKGAWKIFRALMGDVHPSVPKYRNSDHVGTTNTYHNLLCDDAIDDDVWRSAVINDRLRRLQINKYDSTHAVEVETSSSSSSSSSSSARLSNRRFATVITTDWIKCHSSEYTFGKPKIFSGVHALGRRRSLPSLPCYKTYFSMNIISNRVASIWA